MVNILPCFKQKNYNWTARETKDFSQGKGRTAHVSSSCRPLAPQEAHEAAAVVSRGATVGGGAAADGGRWS
jgi:hypothetical protein